MSEELIHILEIRSRQLFVIAEAIFRQMPEDAQAALLDSLHSKQFEPVKEPRLFGPAEYTGQDYQQIAIQMTLEFLQDVYTSMHLGDTHMDSDDDVGDSLNPNSGPDTR